jgi:lysine 6-dehydrogenase
MFPKWTYQPGEEDLTVMRVIVEGVTGRGERRRVTWDLLDLYDRAGRATSMSRTTALPCTAVARLIASGRIHERGVLPPERLGAMPGVLDAVLRELAGKGITYTRSSEAVGPGA